MKLLFLLLVLLSGTRLAGGPPTARVTLASLNKATYAAALQQQVLTKPQVTYPLKKQRGRISIPITGGLRIFQDRVVGTDETNQAEYTYWGYWPQFKHHMVVAHFWEYTEWVLVADNGKELVLPDAPLFAPGLQRFVVASAGIEMQVSPNVVQLFQWKNGGFYKVWETLPTSWEPEQVAWTTATTLMLSKRMWTAARDGTAHEYAKVSIY